MRRPLLFVTLLAGGAALLAPPAARACSCAAGLSATLPTDGATGIPTNAVPLLLYSLSGPDSADAGIRDAQTTAELDVSVEDETFGDVVLRRVRPLEDLAPGTSYTLWSAYEDAVTFTTGGAPDLGAPAGGDVLSSSSDYNAGQGPGWTDTCGERLYVDLYLGQGQDDHPVWYQVVVARDAGFASSVTLPFVGDENAAIGWGSCWTNLPDLDRGERLWLKSRAVDVSGNAGPWGTTVSLKAASCTTGGDGRGTPLSVLLVLGANALRRRAVRV